MTDQELETLLTQQCNSLKLKETAFETLQTIFATNSNDTEFLCGFERREIKTIFDRFEYRIDRRHGDAIIRTRIGLYIENKNWLDDMQPIGYYELETNLSGEVLDDYFVIEKEKYVDDIGVVSHFKSINKALPLEYLRRNHVQYEYIAYISLIGTLFISRQFEAAGIFIKRAYKYLEQTDYSKFDQNYLTETKSFLKMMKDYLEANNLVTNNLKD